MLCSIEMTLADYKTVLYRQEDGGWVAEVPAISGCYALMSTREEALAELGGDVLASLNQKGFLLPIYMTIASLSNIRALIDKKNALLEH